jgi:hypothetical protein
MHLIPVAMPELQMHSIIAAVFCAAGCLKLLLNMKYETPSKVVTGGILLCVAGMKNYQLQVVCNSINTTSF